MRRSDRGSGGREIIDLAAEHGTDQVLAQWKVPVEGRGAHISPRRDDAAVDVDAGFGKFLFSGCE